MKNQNRTASPKPPTRRPRQTLRIELDAVASATVKGWAKLLRASHADVANGLITNMWPEALERRREDIARFARGQSEVYREEFEEMERSVAAAMERRKAVLLRKP